MTNDGVNQYLYDGEGRICAVKTVIAGSSFMTGYLYDAEGNRIAKGAISNWGRYCLEQQPNKTQRGTIKMLCFRT